MSIQVPTRDVDVDLRPPPLLGHHLLHPLVSPPALAHQVSNTITKNKYVTVP